MSKPPFYDVTISLGDVDFIREVVDFLEDILDTVEMQDNLRAENDE